MKRKSYKMNKRIIFKLEEMLRISTMETCGFDHKTKVAIQHWVRGWFEYPLRSVLEEVTGDTKKYRGDE